MDASIKYIVDKIEEIEVEGHKRFQTDVSVDLAGRNDDNKKNLTFENLIIYFLV